MTAQITHAQFQQANLDAINITGGIAAGTLRAMDHLRIRRASDTQMGHMQRVRDASYAAERHLAEYLAETDDRYRDLCSRIQAAHGEVAGDRDYHGRQ